MSTKIRTLPNHSPKSVTNKKRNFPRKQSSPHTVIQPSDNTDNKFNEANMMDTTDQDDVINHVDVKVAPFDTSGDN